MLKSRIALATMAVALALPAAAHADTYVVQLTDAPLATYAGGKDGIPATTPRVTGRKLKADSAPGLDYRAFLARRQAAALRRVSGTPKVIYSYRYALSGFAADLTSAQAKQLAGAPGVESVRRAQLEHVDDDEVDQRLGGPFGEGPAYLRLTPQTGLWDELGGPLAAGGAGAGVIVGDIDTGIQPGHPSFSDHPPLGGAPYTPPAVWDGICEAGPGFATSDCNNKLIGARYFVDGFGATNTAPGTFLSPRDDDGHGTNTAAIAAGNYGVDPSIDGNDLGVDVISGIAPRAYVAAYKVCWNGNGTTPTGCSSADIVKAIDQAVADGVDVINLSLSGATSVIFGPQQASLLNAAAAGVFVVDSAGNNGPDPGTVAQPADVPWTTAVGASTLHRSFESTVTVSRPGDPDLVVRGASVTHALASAPLVDGAQCLPGSLDPALVGGKVVLCQRGGNDRIDKSKQVADAGGVGMILYNATADQELDTDTHWVPTAHVTLADGQAIKAVIDRGDASASLSAGAVDTSQTPRVLAAFSARGPQDAVPDILKPDLSAPGVQILAGMADQPAPVSGNRPGQLFATFQGTSQAAPQVAGAGALLTQVMPTLSPAEIKSELMMTANPAVLKENGVTPATPFDAGAGEIDPDAAAHAGLVLNATLDDYVQYLEFLDPTIVAGDIPKKRPSDLNLPSITFSRLAGRDSTTRTFRSIDPTLTRWTVSVQAPPGIIASANVSSFRISPGQTRAVTVTLTRDTAPLDKWAFGALVLTSGDGRTLRLPISVRPVFGAVTSPVVVSTADAAGSVPVTMRPGWTGQLSELGFGPAAPDVRAGQRIFAGSGRADLTGGDRGTQIFGLDVPAGTQLVSARLSNVDGGAVGPNLDLYLFRDPDGDGDLSDAVLVASSTRGDANEQVNVTFPAAGKYVIAVVGVVTLIHNGTVYDLSSWVVADALPDAGGLAVTGDPVAVTLGNSATLPLQWSGVDAKGLYLGLVTYHADTAPTTADVGATSVVELTKTVDTPTPTPTPTATPTPTPTPAPSATPVPEPGVKVVPRVRRLSVRKVSLSGRRLALWLANASGARVHVAIKRGDRFVASSRARRMPARGAVKLRLNHALRPGRYTVKVIADRDGQRSVVRLSLRRRATAHDKA